MRRGRHISQKRKPLTVSDRLIGDLAHHAALVLLGLGAGAIVLQHDVGGGVRAAPKRSFQSSPGINRLVWAMVMI